MRWNSFIFLLILVVRSSDVSAEKFKEVFGSWASSGSIFVVYEEDGFLQGRIKVIKDAVYLKDEDPKRAGHIRLDDNNPDVKMKVRPLVGIEMFSDYRFEDGQWQGKIYDPESGNTYESKMYVAKDGRLKIRGYIGMPMFGRTSKFDPIEVCSEEIRRMLAMINDSQSCR
ncbi:MAG: hypothetical protein ACI9CE_000673 [Flavobacterium sp.]|jgi:uncharacterized protein (DUF2147 family)